MKTYWSSIIVTIVVKSKRLVGCGWIIYTISFIPNLNSISMYIVTNTGGRKFKCVKAHYLFTQGWGETINFLKKSRYDPIYFLPKKKSPCFDHCSEHCILHLNRCFYKCLQFFRRKAKLALEEAFKAECIHYKIFHTFIDDFNPWSLLYQAHVMYIKGLMFFFFQMLGFKVFS